MEARAERRDKWAEKRAVKATALHAQNERFRGDNAFFTQPGRIIERERFYGRSERAYEHDKMATTHTTKAAGIRSQLDRSIYDDDPDVRERLIERIAELETQRDLMKAANAAYRKEHRAELKALTKYQRDDAVPYPGWALTNLGANIRRNKQRLEGLDRPVVAARLRTVEARRDGDCSACDKTIDAGTLISKLRGTWIHQMCAKAEAG